MSGELQAAPARARERQEPPLWFRVLDRFGLPTMFAVALLLFVLRNSEADRAERRELLSGIKTSIDRQTLALQELAAREEEHADAVRLTWPRVREVERARIKGASP